MSEVVVSPWFTPAEIEDLTAVRRWSAQRRALTKMGIPFLPNAVGRPLVERAAVLKKERVTTRAKTEPNWAALEAQRGASLKRRPNRT